MKKLLLLLLLSLGLIGCSSTAPLQVEVGSESYEWKKWDCFAYGYAGEFLFSIGYIPELKKDGYAVGKLFLKDADSPIDTIYEMKGVQHEWTWDEYQIRIDSDGTGRYWDFSDADKGELVNSSEVYECTSSGYVSFSKSFDNFFSY
jgi:hypothetical protein